MPFVIVETVATEHKQKDKAMSEKSFEEKLKEREAAIRQQWATASKAGKVEIPAAIKSRASLDDASVKQEMMRELELLKQGSPDDVPIGIREMTADDYQGLFERIKEAFVRQDIPAEGIRLEMGNSKWWAVSLFMPYKGLTMKNVSSTVKKVLIGDVGVDKNLLDCLGKRTNQQAYEWYFMPPGLPKHVYDAIAHAGDIYDQKIGDRSIGWGIPLPNKTKDTGEIPLLIVNEELYRQIASGEKTMEYRNLVTYYCDKFFGTGKMVKAVRFQLGYSGKDGGEPEQMTWEVKDIMLVSEYGKLAPAMTNGKMSTFKDLPRVFPPVAYAIKLGNRLPDGITMHDIPDRRSVDAPSTTTIEPETQRLINGIKAGRLKSKSSDGYLVLKAEFYDAIESGEKKVEYRDFSEYNLKRTIGIKTVRFNRGYVKNAPQMRWEVERVVLLDDDDNECDPLNVLDGFVPVRIAIYLGERIG